jgi:hypothetical protein
MWADPCGCPVPAAAVRQPGDHKVASNRFCWRLDFTGDRH